MSPRTRWWGLVLLTVLLAGCAGNRVPLQAEMEQVRAGSHAVLLVRLIGTDQHGTSRQPLHGDWSHDPVAAGWGDFDNGGAPGPWRYQSPSDAAWAEGWVSMVVTPGQYYLSLDAPGQHATLARAGSWRIEVPRGVALLYAGTLVLAERTEPGLFGPLLVGLDPAASAVLDETVRAAAVAARDLPSLPPPRTRLMRRHSGPIRLGVPPE